jgi:hypothetical protein
MCWNNKSTELNISMMVKLPVERTHYEWLQKFYHSNYIYIIVDTKFKERDSVDIMCLMVEKSVYC